MRLCACPGVPVKDRKRDSLLVRTMIQNMYYIDLPPHQMVPDLTMGQLTIFQLYGGAGAIHIW